MIKPRKKTRIEDIRREELIQAAHRVFLIHGLAGLTTARICAEAGMSPGILAYYFKGKEHVLFEMVRYNNRILMEDIIARLKQARTGWERLLAIIEGNFPQSAYHQAQASAWVSVCAAGGANADYAQLQRNYNRRLASNVASALRGRVGPERARPLILMIGVMIDGLWLRKAVDEPIAREEAVALILSQVAVTLGPEVVESLRQGL